MTDTPAETPIHVVANDLTSLLQPLARLRSLEGNPRKGDVAAVARSYARFGQRKPIVALRDGTVIAGNHQYAAATELGWTHIAVVFVDDDDETAKAYALADNRTADLGSYDDDALAAFLAEITDPTLLDATGYSSDEIDAYIAAAQPNPVPQGDPDEVPDHAPSISTLGSLWLLGPHRVMCGDSTNPDQVTILLNGQQAHSMVTDPPYGINYGDTVEFRREMGRGQRPDNDAVVRNDGTAEAVTLWHNTFPLWLHHLRKRGSAFYCWAAAGDQQVDLGIALRNAGASLHGSIIWAKSSFSFSRAEHKYQHEPAWYGWRADGTHTWYGPNNETSLWEYPRPSASPDHPTQKPVELIRRCIRNITPPGGLTLDPFLGSGTAVIAAHLENRICYGMELDPRYVDIICRRYQQITGLEPVNATTGEPTNFIPDQP